MQGPSGILSARNISVWTQNADFLLVAMQVGSFPFQHIGLACKRGVIVVVSCKRLLTKMPLKMHQIMAFQMKNSKNFLGGLPSPHPSGEGTSPHHTPSARRLRRRTLGVPLLSRPHSFGHLPVIFPDSERHRPWWVPIYMHCTWWTEAHVHVKACLGSLRNSGSVGVESAGIASPVNYLMRHYATQN